jgi:hypothetical protein
MRQILFVDPSSNSGIRNLRELFISVDLISFSGGKTGAPTISTDHDYDVLVAALNRKPASCTVGISFDLDGIVAFRIRAKRVCASFDFSYTVN